MNILLVGVNQENHNFKKIKGFYKHYQDRPKQTQDELVKELKETFTKAFTPPNQSNYALIKEVLSDEVILND